MDITSLLESSISKAPSSRVEYSDPKENIYVRPKKPFELTKPERIKEAESHKLLSGLKGLSPPTHATTLPKL
jgi:hypothetical protein